jgi:hypothetical protein
MADSPLIVEMQVKFTFIIYILSSSVTGNLIWLSSVVY